MSEGAKELRLFIDAVDSGTARLMLLDGAVFEFPSALLPDGAREGDEVVMTIRKCVESTYKDDIDALLDSLGDSL